MNNRIYETMLSSYTAATPRARQNAAFEVGQQIILAGLCHGGFFDHAAFYGGTCLRIFHGLERFSEDMDFSLLAPSERFDFTNYFQPIIDAFALVGRRIEIRRKEKKTFGRVESAFLKDTTDVYDLSFQSERSIKIKIEVDTEPPLGFKTEQKLLLQPQSSLVRCYALPDLFAGKMHALLHRRWKNRVKGRDWYDFEWYVRRGVPLNFEHYAARVQQFEKETVSPEVFQDELRACLLSTDMKQVKADVLPFVKNPHDLDIWSNDYFLQLAQHMKMVVER